MTLLEQYEQQYAALIAETTSLISKLHSGLESRELCSKIDGNLAEAQELLEQMGLEIRELNAVQRPSFTNKLNVAQVELKRLQDEYRTTKDKKNNAATFTTLDLGTTGDGDYYDDVSITNDQRQRLLENSERIERTGNRLTEGYRVALETESIGAQLLSDLNYQRETIRDARQRLRETNADLGRASRTLNSMMSRAMRQKVVLYSLGICFIVGLCVSLFLTLTGYSPRD